MKGFRGFLGLPMYLGAVALAGWGVHGFYPHADPRLHAPSGPAAAAAIALAALVLLLIASIWNLNATPPRRIGAREVLAAIPDLALVGIYLIASMLPGLLPGRWTQLLVYAIAVEGIATYTMLWFVVPTEDPDPVRRRIFKIAIPLCALIGVTALSARAGSFWLFAGFVVFLANKLLPDRLARAASAEVRNKRHFNRCMASTAIFLLFGIPAVALAILKPVHLSSAELHFLALAFGAYYFAWLAIFELLGTASAVADQPARA